MEKQYYIMCREFGEDHVKFLTRFNTLEEAKTWFYQYSEWDVGWKYFIQEVWELA